MSFKKHIKALLLVIAWLVLGCGEASKLRSLPGDAVVLAFGDSLTLGVGVSRESSYPAVLARVTGLTVINAGVPGEVTAAGVKRLPRLLREHEPDLVIICHGGNDILRRQSMEVAEANLRAMVQHSKSMNVDVVLVAVPELRLLGSPPGFYEQVARDFNVPIEANILGDLVRDREMKSDHVHLNRVGYQKLAEAISDTLHEFGAL